MGAQQSKVRITVPPETYCFPAYENEEELFETTDEIKKCHLQALQVSAWIGSIIGGPCTPLGHLAFSAATILFTFLIHRLTAPSPDNIDGDKGKCNKSQCQKDTTLEEALIDSKVAAAIAKKSVCELQAKLCVINNRYQRLLSEISVDDRRLEVVPAIQTCEEVLQLFHDPTHVFRLNPLVTSPFLVTFSGIFVAISELSLILIPSYKGPLVGEMNLLSQTLTLYRTACINTRMQNLKFRKLQPESMLHVVANGMAETNYSLEDSCLQGKAKKRKEANATDLEKSGEDEMDQVYHDANEAVAAYMKVLEGEYERFFKPALETVSKFSGFQDSQ